MSHCVTWLRCMGSVSRSLRFFIWAWCLSALVRPSDPLQAAALGITGSGLLGSHSFLATDGYASSYLVYGYQLEARLKTAPWKALGGARFEIYSGFAYMTGRGTSTLGTESVVNYRIPFALEIHAGYILFGIESAYNFTTTYSADYYYPYRGVSYGGQLGFALPIGARGWEVRTKLFYGAMSGPTQVDGGTNSHLNDVHCTLGVHVPLLGK